MKKNVVCRLKIPRDLWPHEATGDWSEDNKTGNVAAEHVIREIVLTGNPNLLGHTAKAMIRKGEYNGTHVGFFHRFGERVLTGAI